MTSTPLSYPVTSRGDHTDDYHATSVADPYRWLEDANSEETRAWVATQNELTFSYLAAIPEREELRARLTRLWDFPKAGVPFKRGGRYFRFRNSGLQNQDVLFVADSLEGEERELLDPNQLSADGTVALSALEVSVGGRFLAYATSGGGSDWQTWSVRNVETGEDLPERLEWSKFSGAAWAPDESGFYYGRYDAPGEDEALTAANYGQKLFFHRLNTPQDQDQLVYARPEEPEWGFGPHVTFDGRFLILNVWKGTDRRNLLFYQNLARGGNFVELVSEFTALYDFVGNDGPIFYLRTDEDAPLGKLIFWNVETGERQDVIPEGRDKLEDVTMVPGGFLVLTLRDARSRLHRHGRDGAFQGEIELPTLGSVLALNAREDDEEVFFSFASFLFPATAYRLDLKSGEVRALETPALDFDSSLYQTHQVFAQSQDGTRVPMFLVHRAGLKLDGTNPTLLYGYGGFGISLTPSFAVSRLPWLELGGVLAIANLRGGGEYGEAWHEAGTVHAKQNVFDDFIACAEHLVSEGYTRPARLAIQGGSNGGLLVGACMTRRPDLFGACLPAVGVLDMLRFHLFTIGWAWVSDYGSSADPEQFQTLLSYSPLHNLREGTCYPATLITTGDHDDRVVPAHSFKFAAQLQRDQGCDNPVLIRVQTRAGHGAGKPTTLVIEEQADILAFLTRVLDIRA